MSEETQSECSKALSAVEKERDDLRKQLDMSRVQIEQMRTVLGRLEVTAHTLAKMLP